MITATEKEVDDEEARTDFRGEETASPPVLPYNTSLNMSSFTMLGRCYPVDAQLKKEQWMR